MSRPDLLARAARAHALRAQAGLLRRLRTVEAIDGAHIVCDGQRLLNFAGNDYLGLAQHPRVREALVDTAQRGGVGATAAHLLSGHRLEHAQLEDQLAQWTGRERALLFSTGYMANLGVLQALLGVDDVCVQDKLNHASLLDAARLCGAERRRYAHADAESAARQLAIRPDHAALLASDGVFSMDGDTAPLATLAALCRSENATLMIDDAHGIGVLGPHGAGSVAAAGLKQSDVPVLMATLGKALGCAGAFVAGSAALIDGLVQLARSFVYTTAMPPALAAAACVAVDIARNDDARRQCLQARIAQFQQGAATRELSVLPSASAIQPLLIGDSARALQMAQRMQAAGFYTPAIRSPTVPAGKARLRITLSALHGETDVERLLDTLVRATAPAA
jgi:8-amino-7-oxononanoate synthase